MAPAAAQPKPQPHENDAVGINAVLLGPPGSGKGTQVSMPRLDISHSPESSKFFISRSQIVCGRHRC